MGLQNAEPIPRISYGKGNGEGEERRHRFTKVIKGRGVVPDEAKQEEHDTEGIAKRGIREALLAARANKPVRPMVPRSKDDPERLERLKATARELLRDALGVVQ